MINTPLVAAMLLLAQYDYGSPPPSSVQGNNDRQGVDVAPFVQLQRKCFDKAIAETKAAALDVRQQRYGVCFALHGAMINHATAKLPLKEAAAAKRDIDRALLGVEKDYAKRMNVVTPGGTK